MACRASIVVMLASSVVVLTIATVACGKRRSKRQSLTPVMTYNAHYVAGQTGSSIGGYMPAPPPPSNSQLRSDSLSIVRPRYRITLFEYLC